MKDIDLVVIGHLLKETIIFSDGEEIGPVLGSPAAYASVAAARLGLKVGIVTKIGKDMPEELLKVFKETGVDTEGVRISGNTTTNFLIYEKSGKKELKFLKKADNILFEDIPDEYLDSKMFLLCPIDYEVGKDMVNKLHSSGKLSMELSGYGGASSKRDELSQEQRLGYLKEIIPYFEIIKGGKEDCQCLFKEKSPDVEELAERFVEWGANISIITLGSEGAVVATNDMSFKIPAFSTNAIDCTGAGDVWHGGFLFEYLKTKDLKNSTIFASAFSSLLIEKTGGVKKERFPAYEQVTARIRSTGSRVSLSKST